MTSTTDTFAIEERDVPAAAMHFAAMASGPTPVEHEGWILDQVGQLLDYLQAAGPFLITWDDDQEDTEMPDASSSAPSSYDMIVDLRRQESYVDCKARIRLRLTTPRHVSLTLKQLLEAIVLQAQEAIRDENTFGDYVASLLHKNLLH